MTVSRARLWYSFGQWEWHAPSGCWIGCSRLTWLVRSARGSSAGFLIWVPALAHLWPARRFAPRTTSALGLIPFQIDAHYPDREAAGPGAVETRQRQILGFLEENDVSVLGMPEGTWLRVSGQTAALGGVTGCVLLRRGTGPQELRAESDVSWLWNLPVSYDTSEPVRRHPARPAESLEGGLQ